MRRLYSMLLALTLVLTTAAPSYGAEPQKVTILSTVSSGLNYYVEYQFNGNTYRSDQVGQAINRSLWNHLDDDQKMKVARVYAFSSNSRIDQFGAEGSDAIADHVNQVQGWTQAAQVFEDRIAKREFPELTEFYTGGYDAAYGEYVNSVQPMFEFTEATKATEEYKRLNERLTKIEMLYNIGSDAYQKLVRMKTLQVGNAIKGGSKPLIELIVSNSFVPVVSATAVQRFTGPAVDGIGLVYDRLKGIYDDYNYDETQDVGIVLDKFWEVIDGLEKISEDCMDEIETELAAAKAEHQQLQEASNAQKQQLQTNFTNQRSLHEAAVGDYSMYYDYGIDPLDENLDSIVAQHSGQLMQDVESFSQELIEKRKEAYRILDPGYTGGEFYINSALIIDTEGMTIGSFTDYSHLNPVNAYNREDLEAIEAAIDSERAYMEQSLSENQDKLEEYEAKLDTLMQEELAKWNDLKARANGLSAYTDINLNTSIYNYTAGSFYNPTQKIMELIELKEMGGTTLEDFTENISNEIDVMDNVVSYFKEVTSEIKSSTSGKMSEYDSLKSNLENSIIYYINAVDSLVDLYNSSPYFGEVSLDSLPAAIDDYAIAQIIWNLPEESRAAKARQIMAELRELRKNELSLLRKIEIGKNNMMHDRQALDEKIGGIVGENTNYATGVKVMSSSDIMAEFNNFEKYAGKYLDRKYSVSNANFIIEKLSLKTPFYYQILMLTEELERERQNIMALSDGEFDNMHEAYLNRHESLEWLGLTNSFYQEQREEIYLAGYPISKLLYDMRARYKNYEDYTSNVDAVRIIDADRGGYLDSAGLDLQVGNTLNLGAYIQPTTADNKTVSWKSSNESVVSVSNSGSIIANKPGVAIITVTTADGGKTSTCKVMVADSYQSYDNWRDTPSDVEREKSWRIRLSEPVDPGSVNSDNVYILDGSGQKLDFIVPTVEEDEAGQYIHMLNTDGFAEGDTYTLVITPKVKSMKGEYLTQGIKMGW
ncbi:MAG: hypothetical protein GT589_05045 [Peptoclostridium sp.]|uniref:Ig-like domain-containing protein n=1 Tax=Peptoclostridium sp. TaxID=1904860 RepID=UPI00139E8E99|nr:Ig-like domain-containing protein [Peptoclostridium sp.]MZQ75509.1 hypothetical protein [Peptoclostridium sp.]